MYEYIEIAEGEIRSEKREAVHRAIAFCCKELRIPAPGLRWFAPSDNAFGFSSIGEFANEGDLLGLATRDNKEIWIRADLPIDETAETVAHECLHILQFFLGSASDAAVEERADQFGEHIAGGAYLQDDESYLDYLAGKDFSGGRFKNKELTEGWRRFGRGGSRGEGPGGDVTQEGWFKEAARREQEALSHVRRSGMALGDVLRAGQRRG